MNIFSSHPSFERLIDLVEGRLPPLEQTSLLAHLSTCTRCAADQSWLKRVIDVMRTDTGEDAPPAVIARARRLFKSRQSPAPTERRRISAQLYFDSRQQAPALGVRGGQAVDQQLLLKAEAYDLDLRLTPADTVWQLSGQVLGPDVAGQVELHGSAGPLRAELNDLGEFNLPAIPPGRYQLTLRLAHLEVDFPALEIGT
jgi:anti-sigma factor RsiW